MYKQIASVLHETSRIIVKKNSQALLEILSTLRIPKHSLLVTLDIESLYTNISHEEAIICFIRKFKGHPLIVFMLDLLKYVLKNSVFVFDNLIFAQLCGIAMGTKWVPNQPLPWPL